MCCGCWMTSRPISDGGSPLPARQMIPNPENPPRFGRRAINFTIAARQGAVFPERFGAVGGWIASTRDGRGMR